MKNYFLKNFKNVCIVVASVLLLTAVSVYFWMQYTNGLKYTDFCNGLITYHPESETSGPYYEYQSKKFETRDSALNLCKVDVVKIWES